MNRLPPPEPTTDEAGDRRYAIGYAVGAALGWAAWYWWLWPMLEPRLMPTIFRLLGL